VQKLSNRRGRYQIDISTLHGLSSEEAQERLIQYGRNILAEDKSRGVCTLLLRQFASPLIYILIGAAVVSFAAGELVDGTFIVVVLVINGLVGTVQEYFATRAIDNLLIKEGRRSKVLRDGMIHFVDPTTIVPGDVLVLQAGDYVAADIEWNEAINLELDESVLTGESMGVSKTEKDLTYAGTFVTRGRGVGTVYATGLASELGKISESITQTSMHDPPLVIRVNQFAKQIAILIGLGIGFVVIYGIIVRQPAQDLFLMAVGLAVSAIPEGLPVAMSVTLAVATRRMARKNVIIRRSTATESLGSCTVIATDKTGTLTENRVELVSVATQYGQDCVVRRWNEISNVGLEKSRRDAIWKTLIAGILATDEAQQMLEHISDPLDVALMQRAHEIGIVDVTIENQWAPHQVQAFDSSFRFSAILHHYDDTATLYVKGAFEEIRAFCTHVYVEDGIEILQEETLQTGVESMTREGIRMLAVAKKKCTLSHTIESALSEGGFIFLGMLGFQDPLRREVPEAVVLCKQAKINLVVVTGDDPRTAARIAQEAGIFDPSIDVVTSGAEIEAAQLRGGDKALDQLVQASTVFARISPAQKLEIVHSLVRQDHFVAVTGDGINDAPALRHAHVGVAMGLRGTDIAREVADIVVADDNFASIVAGIQEGRVVYSNIRKVVFMLVSTGCGEVVLFILSIASGLPMPLTPAQLLWLNLITEGVQDIALAFERAEGDELRRPPRAPKEQIFDRLMKRRIATSAIVMGIISTTLFYIEYQRQEDLNAARSAVLTLFVVFENVQALHARSEYKSLLQLSLFSNPWLIIGIVSAQTLHILALMYPDLFSALDLSKIRLDMWILIALSAALVCVVIEVDKWFLRRAEYPSRKSVS
jgi:Ca2+-transporting ATPase